jgi:molybdenum cofactor cytidylyltransferase
MSLVAVIVLAAGRSTRFSDGGAHKLLAPIGGDSVIRHSVRAAVDSAVGEVVVITGAESDAIAAQLVDSGVRVVHEPRHAEGMAVSLRRGVETLRSSVGAVIVALGDQPTVRPDAYRRIVAAWRESRSAIVVPRYRGPAVPAHPTLFDASTFDELLGLSGDVGARSVVTRDPTRVAQVELDWPAPRDIDTPADLAVVAREPNAVPTGEPPTRA